VAPPARTRHHGLSSPVGPRRENNLAARFDTITETTAFENPQISGFSIFLLGKDISPDLSTGLSTDVGKRLLRFGQILVTEDNAQSENVVPGFEMFYPTGSIRLLLRLPVDQDHWSTDDESKRQPYGPHP